MIQAIAFLGNMGAEYQATRHNTAWQFADTIDAVRCAQWQHKFKGQLAIIDSNGKKLYVIKPETYMNLSGEAVGAMLAFYKLQSDSLLVVHDELELPLGTISLKWSGGLGGHNGLRSIKTTLGTADFWRLRFGIGRPQRGDVSNYVLSPFTEDESILMHLAFDAARQCLGEILQADNIQPLIKTWGKKKIAD